MRNEKGEKGGILGENEVFWRKNEKSCEKIWWNQIKFVPLHPLTKRKGV